MEVRRRGKAVGRNLAKSNARSESCHSVYDVREHEEKDRYICRRCSATGMDVLRYRRDSKNDSYIVNIPSAARANKIEGTDHVCSIPIISVMTLVRSKINS